MKKISESAIWKTAHIGGMMKIHPGDAPIIQGSVIMTNPKPFIWSNRSFTVSIIKKYVLDQMIDKHKPELTTVDFSDGFSNGEFTVFGSNAIYLDEVLKEARGILKTLDLTYDVKIPKDMCFPMIINAKGYDDIELVIAVAPVQFDKDYPTHSILNNLIERMTEKRKESE